MNSDNAKVRIWARTSIDVSCHQMWDLFSEMMKRGPVADQGSMAAQIKTALTDPSRDIRILATTCAAFLLLGPYRRPLDPYLIHNILQDSDPLSKIASAAALIRDVRIDSKLDFTCKGLIDFYLTHLVPPDVTKPTGDLDKVRLVLSSIPYHVALGTTLSGPRR